MLCIIFLLFPRPLLKASFHRVRVNNKTPAFAEVFIALRRGGDSNPRYPNRVRQFSKLVD